MSRATLLYKVKIILLIGFIFFSGNQAWAIDLPRLSQTKIRLSVAPGESGYGEINVENMSSGVMPLHMYLEDWSYAAGGDGSKIFAPSGSKPYSCASWITFSPQDFRLSPFGRQKVNYTVKLPADAKGGYYAALFFETEGSRVGPEGSAPGVGINLIFRLAVLFYVEAKGTVKREGIFENLAINKEDGARDLSIDMDFTNTGNVDITAGGSFHIMDKKGMVYSRGEFGDIYTFSGEKARLSAKAKGPLPQGKYDLVLTLDLGKALKEAKMGRGPVITREVEIEVADNGQVVRIGGLK